MSPQLHRLFIGRQLADHRSEDGRPTTSIKNDGRYPEASRPFDQSIVLLKNGLPGRRLPKRLVAPLDVQTNLFECAPHSSRHVLLGRRLLPDPLPKRAVERADRCATFALPNEGRRPQSRARAGFQLVRVGLVFEVDDLEGEQPPVELDFAQPLEALCPSRGLVAPGANRIEVESHGVHDGLPIGS